MRELDASDVLPSSTYEMRLPAQAAALGESAFKGSYPAFKKTTPHSSTDVLFRLSFDWAYESQKDHAVEDGESIPIEERLVISQSGMQRAADLLKAVHAIFTTWGIPHAACVADGVDASRAGEFGVAVDLSEDGAPCLRAWSSENALTLSYLQQRIDEAQSLDEVRELVRDTERESEACVSLPASAERLSAESFSGIERAFSVFLSLRKASEVLNNRYAPESSRPTALMIAGTAEEAPPQEWLDALGRPCFEKAWPEIRSALWRVAFEELPPATRWACVRAEFQRGPRFYGKEGLSDYCLLAERAHAMIRAHSEVVKATPLPANCQASFAKAVVKPETPAEEQRVLNAVILLDRVFAHPEDLAPIAASRPANRL